MVRAYVDLKKMVVQKFDRSIDFDYVVYNFKDKVAERFVDVSHENTYSFETLATPGCSGTMLDVCITIGPQLDKHMFYNRCVKDDDLTEIVKKLREEIDLNNCMIVSFHDDRDIYPIVKNDNGIGKRLPIKYRYSLKFLKHIDYYADILEEIEYTVDKYKILYVLVKCC